MDNPFVTKGYAGPDYFCDRVAETQQLVELTTNGNTGKPFIKKYHLQTVSVITAAVRALLDKDLITADKGTYMVYDPFLALWMKQNC